MPAWILIAFSTNRKPLKNYQKWAMKRKESHVNSLHSISFFFLKNKNSNIKALLASRIFIKSVASFSYKKTGQTTD